MGEVDLMKFRASCIQFGRIKVDPLEDVELSNSQLRIIFRVDKLSTSISMTEAAGSVTNNIRFEANLEEFVKTIYSWHDNSATILFRAMPEKFNRIRTEINRLLEVSKQFHGEWPWRWSDWIIIKTAAFDDLERRQFEEIASYLIGCDEIPSDRMNDLVNRICGEKQNGDGIKIVNVSALSAEKNGANGNAAAPLCIIEYPLNEKGAATVTVPSYECLGVGEYLDDAIIDFYAEYLRRELITSEQRDRIHIFSVHFYNVLTARSSARESTKPGLTVAQKRHERIAKWTKDIDIFEKDFLFVPINKKSHWFLVVICFPSLVGPVYWDTNESVPNKKGKSTSKPDPSKPIKQPCILIFDSLGISSKDYIVNVLREYLTCEYEAKSTNHREFDAKNMPSHNVRSPHQPNLADCGLFVLQNMEQFLKDPIKSFELPIIDLAEWYDPEVATRKRKDIAKLIQELMSTHGKGFQIKDLPAIELPK